MSLASSLENQFLIAMPKLEDPYFSNTVTYLWKHNAQGALGIVINKPLLARIPDIFDELDIECRVDDAAIFNQHVLSGGPVERDKGFIIHNAGDRWDSSIEVNDEVAICTSKTILQAIAEGDGPGKYQVALGCAGWEAGQLEREISENAWLTTPASTDILFSQDYEAMAQAAASTLGIDMHQLSPDAGHS